MNGFPAIYCRANPIYRYPVFVLIVIFCVLFSSISTVYAEKNKVLVLHSYHHRFEWTKQVMAGIESVLNKSDIDVELLVEYMDTKFHKPEILFPHLQEIYAAKYGEMQPDIVIASDNNAFDFLLNNRGLLFPNVPIVFCSINNYSDSLLTNQSEITGVAEDFDFEGTIDLALRLHPETRQIAVVSDSTHTAMVTLERIKRSFAKFTDRVSFVELTDMTAQEFKQALNRLPDNTLVVLNGLYRDRIGRIFSGEEGLAFVANNSQVPVYVMWQQMIDQGILGGVAVSGFSQGQQAALMAVRILHGESSRHIPVLKKSPNVPVFDYNAMVRFNIDRSDLQEDSIVLNIPSSFYAKHKSAAWITITGIVILIIIIFILLFNISIRKKTEDKLKKHQDHLEDLVKKRTAELEKDIIANKQTFKDFKEQKEFNEKIIQTSSAIIVGLDRDHKITLFNRGAEKITGFKTREVIEKDWFKIFFKPDLYDEMNTAWEEAWGSSSHSYINPIQTKNGDMRIISWQTAGLYEEDDETKHMLISIGEDITERKLAEEAVKEAQHYTRGLVDANLDALVVISAKGKITDINIASELITGVPRKEIIGTDFLNYFSVPDAARKGYQQVFRDGYVRDYPLEIKHRDGSVTPVLYNASVYKDAQGNVAGVLAAARDITERRRAEEQIKASLKEKEVLLKEIHHRVKNNMQVISSLLKLQAANIKDDRITQALMDSQGRVQAMAFVHETLYSSDRLAAIDFKVYVSQLAKKIAQSYGVNKQVKLTIDAEDISLGIEQATHLGLIINELVSNSFKYAFPENRHGEISIRFQRIDQEMSKLIFQDNGSGISKDVDWRNSDSLGLQLIVLLAENQLDGTIDLNRDSGTRFTIKFNLKETE